MKRRKKLWIACVALVAVAALCAFALFYRPVPYRFLEGARVDAISSHPVERPGKPTIDFTYYEYGRTRTVESVMVEAHQELATDEGWHWEDVPQYTKQVDNPRADELILFDDLSGEYWGRPYARVFVIRPTTLLDRALEWIHNR